MRRLFFILVIATIALGGCNDLASVDPSIYPVPERDAITFWGHACSYTDVGGAGIVTDPVFDKFLWNRHRFIGSPPDAALQGVRVVLISHAHNDHLSEGTLRRFPKDTVILCPPPTAKFLAGKRIAARAMAPGEEFRLGEIRFIPVAVMHPGGRRSLHRAMDGNALGWVVITPSTTIFYSGDTDYCPAFAGVGETYAPDVAILNVNHHLEPPDAARAAHDLKARVVIPSHWGAFGYWIFGGNRGPRGEKELERLLGDRLHVLRVGQSFKLADAHSRTP